ncbi:MAG: hypothetical protein HC896_14770, partial [Bacteroidales bacterium]|nr:hypothetical protein [Bacteroidales bacterium]
KVYVNDVLQKNDANTHDFTSPVVYTIVSPNGTSASYIVEAKREPVVTEAEILSYNIPALNVTGEVDTVNNTIYLLFPTGTDLTSKYVAEFKLTPYARLRENGKPQNSGVTANGFSDTLKLRVTAEDGATVSDYFVLSDMKPTIYKAELTNLVPSVNGTIDQGEMTIIFEVLSSTNVTDLTLSLDIHPDDATITIVEENSQQVSKPFENNVTKIDLSSPVKIKLTNVETGEAIYTLTKKILIRTFIMQFTF